MRPFDMSDLFSPCGRCGGGFFPRPRYAKVPSLGGLPFVEESVGRKSYVARKLDISAALLRISSHCPAGPLTPVNHQNTVKATSCPDPAIKTVPSVHGLLQEVFPHESLCIVKGPSDSLASVTDHCMASYAK
jgi:hypothetical protein